MLWARAESGMAMRTRNWQIGAAVVAGLAALQSPLMLPAGLVLLGRWVYLDTAAPLR
jgi:hypothetical protein